MSLLLRYLDPAALRRMMKERLEPRGPVTGNLVGGHRSTRSGFAVEFAGHREYVPGDDPKHIDWRVSFNRDRHVIKQYQMETNLVCHLAIDASESMRYGDGPEQKLLYASRMSATLAQAIVRQGDKVSLTTFDERILDFVPPSNSPPQIVRIVERLDSLQPLRKTALAKCLTELSARAGRREIVMVWSDFFGDLETLETALGRLRYHRHEVVLFQVLHHDELAFDFAGPVNFIGLEDEGDVTVDAIDVREAYLAALSRYNGLLEAACQRNRVERVLVDTGRDMAEVLIDYLASRARL